ncbi:thioredoxin [Arthrobacter sp. MA-N2]|uniref:thioredoxin n=1 Tax=Arthrobacter sp. MA-N2 TaxID=1101188 RepID=UPI000481F7AE|nr:thioredoxin [Arthrobacter sp. MA-N2]
MNKAIIVCPNCGTSNRVPAASAGKPRCGNCRHWLPWIVDAGDEDFRLVAEESSVPVLVDFWAVWCGPCRTVSPVLDQLARERAGNLKLVRVDVDQAPRLSSRFGIQAIPTLMVLIDGKIVARQAGAAPAQALRSWLDGAIARVS